MYTNRCSSFAALLIAALVCPCLLTPVFAEEKLPHPDPEFQGKIGKTYKESTPSYPAPVRAPKGSPNVLIILLDDVGFGMCSTFGGPVPTPNLEKLSANGLKYNRFHTTALCSPSRAALLTGRNHHSCGTGVIIEMGTGYPGYTGIIPLSTAPVSKTLKDNGYATAMFGKWHNTPEMEISPAGPFDRWPTGLGFDYFYGFNQGEADQYHPTLYRNTTPVAPPKTYEQGYHFTADMTDEAIEWTRNVRAADRDKPWFAYFSTGAVHAPHQVPAEWREKFSGQFDHGWDRQRELTFENQKKMGVIPADAKLTPRPKELPAWKEQSDDAKKVFIRLMENYAGFMAHTDHHVGRLIDSLEQSGELDNTLVIYIVGDNGASAEGGLEGTFSELASLMGVQLGLQSTIKRIDEIGGPTSEPHVPVGWAWAMDSPFQWTKQVASHFGGTRNPLVVHWPKGIKAKGEQRSQFHHIIDVVPTILEAFEITVPDEVNGIKQKPLEGISMRYSFDDANAKDRRTTQYFEMMTNRALYKDGWLACSRFGVPWTTAGKEGDFLDSPWELYNVDEDFSQANDLSAQEPEKLKELQAEFLVEAEKYDVLPLDPRMAERMDPRNRLEGEPKSDWTYYGNRVRLPEPVSPLIFPSSHTITAEVQVPEAGAEGVIACCGGYSSGWTLYIQDNKPHFAYTFFDLANSQVDGTMELPTGKVTIKSQYEAVGPMEKGGTLRLFVNGQPAGEGQIKRVGFRSGGLEPFEVGRDSITSIVPTYKDKGDFEFTGTIDEIKFELSK